MPDAVGPEPASPPVAPLARGRSALRWQRVLLGLALITGLALGGFFFAYYKLVYYKRVAALHLPAQTQAAARLDVEQVVLFAPLRKHLFPLLEQLGERQDSQATEKRARLKRFEALTGISLGLDLRELVLACGSSLSDWHLAVGGRFPDDPDLVAHISEFLRAEGWSAGTLSGDGRRIDWPLGLSLSRAGDGVLILASNRAWLDSSLEVSSRFSELGLLRDGPGSFAWQAPSQADRLGLGWPSIAGQGIGAQVPLGDLEQVTAFVSLELPTSIEVHLRARASGAELQRNLELALGGLRVAGALFADSASPWSFLSRAQTHLEGEHGVVLRTDWTETEIDAAAAAAANRLRDLLR